MENFISLCSESGPGTVQFASNFSSYILGQKIQTNIHSYLEQKLFLKSLKKFKESFYENRYTVHV